MSDMGGKMTEAASRSKNLFEKWQATFPPPRHRPPLPHPLRPGPAKPDDEEEDEKEEEDSQTSSKAESKIYETRNAARHSDLTLLACNIRYPASV
jgi:hypothetical protein